MNRDVTPITDLEIRAWDEEEKCMITWDELQDESYDLPRQIWNVLSEDHYKKMFATPFKDKNGVRIYENDILIHREYDEVVMWYQGMRHGDYEGYFAKVEWLGDGNGYGLKACCAEELDIIGNTYEDPELIEKYFYKKVRGFDDTEKCEHEWEWYSAVMYSSPLQRDRKCTKCLKVERHYVGGENSDEILEWKEGEGGLKKN